MKSFLFLLLFGTVFFTATAFGQQTVAEQTRQAQEKYREDQRIRQLEEQRRRESQIQQRKLDEWNREMAFKSRRPRYKTLTKKEIEKIKAELAPSAEDLNKYKTFLQQSDTGIFRLMPNLGCSQKFVVSAEEDCQNSIYIGEYYSFLSGDYSEQTFFDLTFKDGRFVSRGYLSLGIITSLGDVPLESISLDSAGAKYLYEYQPPTESKVVNKFSKELSAGFSSDNFKYADSEKALLNGTYALRIVGYRPSDKYMSRILRGELTTTAKNLFIVKNLKRSDKIVAFKIVGKDTDGSLIILWKQLVERKAPTIIFPEK